MRETYNCIKSWQKYSTLDCYRNVHCISELGTKSKPLLLGVHQNAKVHGVEAGVGFTMKIGDTPYEYVCTNRDSYRQRVTFSNGVEISFMNLFARSNLKKIGLHVMSCDLR